MLDARIDSLENNKPKVELPFVDGLRGVAILLVVANHWVIWGMSSPNWHFPKSADWLIVAGQRGVQLFFIVSAFTLFLSFSSRALTEAHPVRNFYLRRGFRILPLWCVAMFFYALYFDRFTFQDLAPNLFMYFGFYRYTGVSLVDFQWSLFVEEVFYVGFPFFFGLLSSLRAALAFLAIAYSTAYLWTRLAALANVPTVNHFVDWFPLNHGPAFAVGIVLVFLWKRKVLSQRQSVPWLYLGLVPMVLESFNQATSRGLLAATALFVLAALPSGPLAWLCRKRWLGSFGRCCYSIYLFHYVLMRALASSPQWNSLFPWPNLPAEIRFLAELPLVASFCLAGGLLLYHRIEKPFIEAGSKIIKAFDKEAFSFSLLWTSLAKQKSRAI